MKNSLIEDCTRIYMCFISEVNIISEIFNCLALVSIIIFYSFLLNLIKYQFDLYLQVSESVLLNLY